MHANEETQLASLSSESTLIDQVTTDDELHISPQTLIKQEAWWLLTSSVPLSLSYLCQNSFNFISMLSVGKLGVDELAAASLSVMIVNFIVLMPSIGLARLHMQRGLVAVSLQLIPAGILFIFIDPLLVLLGQTDQVAVLCGKFLRIWFLGSWPIVAFECLKRFTQAQGIMQASTWVIAMVMPVHAFNNYFPVWSPTFGLGFAGAPLTTVISSWMMFAGLLLYIAFSDARAAWGGFSWKCLDGIWEFYRLAIPSAAMLACSWGAFELVTFGSSLFGSVSMAAQACIFSAISLTYQTPAAIGSATATRIGNSLGLGKQRRARYSAYVAIAIGYVIGIVCSLLLFIYRHNWGYIFTDNRQVVELCALLMPYFAAVQTYDSISGLIAGIMRAMGKQGLGALFAFSSFWMLGIPVGFYLALGPPKLEVVGLWIGLAVAVITFSVAQQWYIFFRVNWRHEVKECLDRLARSTRTRKSGQHPSTESYGAIA
ncbi:MATE efflux family protein [Coemansia reversa NRRL 1564]|uniref:MATE efflux family protein n=1 Tax=Coemansia reversa (strain ATCC 12441 / NRRL 1564) TaxID=763665 RepID=A0A2G5BCP4_COERN|nr:MATE efflux family protein [Coemansia reversa NRRL 1564]|eukprot:PIA16487.1 MATE efflux family protein [Coemansia reversa NRRL 1564]